MVRSTIALLLISVGAIAQPMTQSELAWRHAGSAFVITVGTNENTIFIDSGFTLSSSLFPHFAGEVHGVNVKLSQTIIVTNLGCWCFSNQTATVAVCVWSNIAMLPIFSSGISLPLIASNSLTMGVANNWYWCNVTPFAMVAGQNYVIGVRPVSGDTAWYQVSQQATFPVVTNYSNATFLGGTWTVYDPNSVYNTAVNVKYQ